jgi:putative hemolysin
MIIHQLQRLARDGDVVHIAGYRFEVLDLDGRRIDKVLVTPPGAVRTS